MKDKSKQKDNKSCSVCSRICRVRIFVFTCFFWLWGNDFTIEILARHI